MEYQIFNTDAERAEAIKDLESLTASPGWQIVLKALQLNEQHEDNKLHTERYETTNEFYLQQDVVLHLRKLKQLPTLLLQEARKVETVEEEDDADPYDHPAEPPTQP